MILNINLQEDKKEPFQEETDELIDQNQNQKFTTNYRIEIPENLKNEVLLLLDESYVFDANKLLTTMQLEQERQQNLYEYFERQKDFKHFYQPNAQDIIDDLQKKQNCSNFDTLLNQINDPFADRQKMIMQQLMSVKKIFCHLSTDEDTYYTSRIYDIYFTENQSFFIASSTNGQVKIFETENLKLIRTLKGNKKEITMIVCDQQSQVLCFTDGQTIFAYNFQTYTRLCELEVPGVVEFSCMDLYTKDNQTLLFLSDNKCGLFVFRLTEDNLFQQIDISAYICSYVKQFEFDKKKLILYTYRQDYLDVWNVQELLDKKLNYFHPMKQINIDQRGQNFHLPADMVNVFIVYDRNFHSICKVVNDTECKELLKQKYKKLNFAQKERNQAICNNKSFTIIAVNTFQKGEDDDEFEQPIYELYIYANINSEQIQLLDHISQENNPTILQLNDSVCVISSNPVYANIFLLGLSEGNLIILDIESLQVLQIISEDCDHLNQPAMKNPVLEAQFLSNGMDIITGTYFGSINMYSIDVQQQNIFQNPDQQFFLNDYTLESDQDQGMLCDSNMRVHNLFESNNLDEIYQNFYEMNVEDIINQILKKDEIQKRDFEYEMTVQKGNFQQKFNIGQKPEIRKLYDYKTEEQIKEKKKKQYNLDRNRYNRETVSINSSVDSISYNKLKRRGKRFDFQEEQDGYRLKSKRLRDKNFKIEESNEELEEQEYQIMQSSNDELQDQQGLQRERRKPQKIDQQILEQYDIPKEPDVLCSFCQLVCNSEKEICQICQEIYCHKCSQKLFFIYNRHVQRCYICYYKLLKLKYDYVQKWTHQKECSRFYIDIEMQNFVENDSQILIFQPQIQEQYYFIPQAYQYFFQTYFNHFDAEWALENIKQLLLLENDFCIQIKDYSYQFPQTTTLADLKLSKDTLILQKITAIIDDDVCDQVKDMLGNNKEIEFYFSYTDQPNHLFLVPKSVYQYCQINIKSLKNNSVIEYKNESVFLNRIFIGDTLFNSIEYLEMQEGKNLRNKRDSEKLTGHPWFITTFVDQTPVEEKLIKNQLVYREFQSYVQNNKQKYEPFLEAVNKDYYPDYLSFVQVEMYLNFIEERLRNNYYYCKQSLFKDIELIEQNCKKFNEPDSQISKLSEQLVKEVKELIENLLKSRKYGRPLVVERNNLQQDISILNKKLSRY